MWGFDGETVLKIWQYLFLFYFGKNQNENLLQQKDKKPNGDKCSYGNQ